MEEQEVKVYILSCPGWAMDMVTTSMEDVLATIQLEVDELYGTKSDGIAFDVSVSQDYYPKSKVDNLPEFTG